MNNRPTNATPFYALLERGDLTVSQYEALINSFTTGQKPAFGTFERDTFQLIIKALSQLSQDVFIKTNKRVRYSIGYNPTLENGTHIDLALAENLKAELFYYEKAQYLQQKEARASSIIKTALEAGMVRVDSSTVDLSKYPTMVIGGKTIRVLLVAE